LSVIFFISGILLWCPHPVQVVSKIEHLVIKGRFTSGSEVAGLRTSRKQQQREQNNSSFLPPPFANH